MNQKSGTASSNSARELRADLQLLLECLNCQMYDPSAVKQSLLGIGSLCSSNSGAKDMLREDGGLQYLLNLLLNTEDDDIQETAMYTLGCAIENNVYSQKQLTTGAVFTFLRNVLKETQQKARVHQTACFLLLSVVTNNGQGQTMARTSECLAVLMNIFKTCLPEDVRRRPEGRSCDQAWFQEMGVGRSFDVWAAATSALCGCLNNPQNDENQRLCVGVFPQAFILLQQHNVPEVVRPIMSLIGLATANNFHNQVRVQTAGGVRVLIAALHRAVNRLDDPEQRQLAAAITSTIDTFISDNQKVAEECGQHGMVLLLLQLLRCTGFAAGIMMRLVITLGHLLESSATHQLQFVKAGGVNVLISLLTDSEDAELSKAIKYVLQTCVDTARELSSQAQGSGHGHSKTAQREQLSSDMESTMAMEKMILQKIKNLEQQLSADTFTSAQLGFPCTNKTPSTCSVPELAVPMLPQTSTTHTAPYNYSSDFTVPMPPPNRSQSAAIPNFNQPMPTPPHKQTKAIHNFNQYLAPPSYFRPMSPLDYNQSLLPPQRKVTAAPPSLRDTEAPPCGSLVTSPSDDWMNYLTPETRPLGPSPRPVPKVAGHSRQRAATQKLETELEKERTLRRSLEAKANSMQHELDTRQRADQAAAVASELLKQGRASQKRKIVNQKPVRRAQSRARLGDSQCVTSESSPDQSSQEQTTSSDYTPSPRQPAPRRSTRQSLKSSRRNTPATKPNKRSSQLGRKPAAPVAQKKSKLTKNKQQLSKTQTDGTKLETRPEDVQSVSIGLQTEVPSDDQPFTNDQLKTPHNTSIDSVCPRTVGVQTPTHIAGPLHIPVGRKLGDHFSLITKTDAASQYNPIEDTVELDASESAPNKISFSSSDKSQTKVSIENISPQFQKEKSRLRDHHTMTEQLNKTNPTSNDAERVGFSTPSSRTLRVLRRVQSTPNLCVTPRSSRNTSRISRTPRRQACPPSPCPSEFDSELIKAANSTTGIALTHSCSQESPSPSVGSGKQLWKVTRPMTPLSAGIKKFVPQTYRTSHSTSSLSRILANNHRDTSQFSGSQRKRSMAKRVSHGSGDGLKDDDNEPLDSSHSDQSVSPCNSTSDSVIRQRIGNSKCPACQPPEVISGPLLNSRTFNFAIETSGTTCRQHRVIREAERDFMKQFRQRVPVSRPLRELRKRTPKKHCKSTGTKDVYDFSSSGSECQDPGYLSPPSMDVAAALIVPAKFYKKPQTERRQRVPYSEQEIKTLLSAVRRQGKAWHCILTQNTFHTSRTALDLKDKYKQLLRSQAASPESSKVGQRPRQPFSMAEERRLRRGVKLYGYNWKVIFDAFRFAPGRRPQELRSKWKSMHQK